MITREKLAAIVGEEKADELLEMIKKDQGIKTKAMNAQKFRMTAFPTGEKINPQLKALCETAVALDVFTLPELGKEAVESGRLETKQDPGRVAAFYRKKLIDLGMEAVDDTTEDA